MSNLGARLLKKWRVKNKLSQTQASSRLGAAHPISISRWERGVTRPSRASAFHIAAATGGLVKIDSWDREPDGVD